MKSLIVMARILFVGGLWSIVFIEGIRVIMLCNWHFDIFWPDHWNQAYKLWKAGWVVRAPKEWAFVLLLITFFPMLFTGWWTLCMVAWEDLIFDALMFPIQLYRRMIKAPINVIKTNNKYGVVKKKSYKQIRPAGVGSIRMPISDYSDGSSQTVPAPALAIASPAIRPQPLAKAPVKAAVKTSIPDAIDHALFKFDDEDDDFDLDIDSFEKSDMMKKKTAKPKPAWDDDDERPQRNKKDGGGKKPAPIDDDDEDDDFVHNTRKNSDSRAKNKNNRDDGNRQRKDEGKREKPARESKNEHTDNKSGRNKDDDNKPRNPVQDVLQQKGFEVISGTTVGNTLIDFIGVSENEICLCMIDKENGDWLADEELFNGEEPLWFSENSHRVSPVRKLDLARNIICDKISDEGFEQNVKSFVIIQMANIINADDMFEIWNNMNIEVTRINRGAPKEIRLFSKVMEDADGEINRKDLDKLRKVLKNIK